MHRLGDKDLYLDVDIQQYRFPVRILCAIQAAKALTPKWHILPRNTTEVDQVQRHPVVLGYSLA